MKLYIQEVENRGTEAPISYKPDSTIKKKTYSMSDALKVGIKTQPGKVGSQTISLYVPVF